MLSLGSFHQPRLVWDHQLVPLGVHSSQEAAEAAYDAAKMLVSRWAGRLQGCECVWSIGGTTTGFVGHEASWV